MKRVVVFVLTFFCSCNYAQIDQISNTDQATKVTKIIVWESVYNVSTSIILNHLNRALQLTTPEYGEYQLIKSVKMEQGRSILELNKHKNSTLDLATYAPTAEREAQAITIRIPLINGLMGYRLCLINESKQATFQGIKNKTQFINNGISIGQHQNWPDTDILRSNNIHVTTTHKRDLLIPLLLRDRFDCYSRGANEIYNEFLTYHSQGVNIEKQLMLYYPLPLFFFVNKSRPLLAERIQLGLERLIESGEFDRNFELYYAPIINKLKLTERTIIDLNNPSLSSETVNALKTPTDRFRKKFLQKKSDR